MTSLNTHIPLEYVKQSKALSDIHEDIYCSKVGEPDIGGYIVSITIADIIDNAEELFGKSEILCKCIQPCRCREQNELEKIYRIIEMCYRGLSIEEICSYILSNIKE